MIQIIEFELQNDSINTCQKLVIPLMVLLLEAGCTKVVPRYDSRIIRPETIGESGVLNSDTAFGQKDS